MKGFMPGAVLIGLLWAASSSAETAYVTDILQLGLHRAADTSDRAFENLVSGTALEVLERSANYARVRTPDGQEGWVKAAYIVSEAPARYRLAVLEAEIGALRERLAEAETASAHAKREAARLQAGQTAQQESADALRETVARLERDNAAYAARFDSDRLSLPLSWVLGALALTLVVGGLTGWWGLDTLIRRRYAGYRIY